MKLSKKQKKALKIAGWSLFGLTALSLAREAYLSFGSDREAKRKLYEAAYATAQAQHKTLIVLGDPDKGLLHHFLGRDYQCGDICIDPLGCGGCPQGVTAIADDPTHALSQMKTDSAVIFDAGSFAFAADGYALAQEMQRVSNGRVFMWDNNPYTWTAFFEPQRKRRVFTMPPGDAHLTWKTGLLSKEPSTGERNGSVDMGALGPNTKGLGYFPLYIANKQSARLGFTPQPGPYHVERLVSRPQPFMYTEL